MSRIIYTLVVILAAGLPAFASGADCWEVTDKHGSVSTVSHIWHIRDKIGGSSALIGKLNGEDIVLPVNEVKSLRVIGSESGGWLGFLKGGVRKIDIQLEDGKKGVFISDLNLFTSKDESAEHKETSFADLKSIVRCKKAPVVAAKKPASKSGMQKIESSVPAVETSPFDAVHLKNGDILNGSIYDMDIRWKASYATLLVPVENIRNMKITDVKTMQGVLELKTGGRVSGILENSSVKIKLSFGQTIDIATDNIKEVSFSSNR